MNVVSTFSGVGGLDLGLARAGLRHDLLCEADAYRRAVLAERFPGVPIAPDVREVAAGGEGRPIAGVVGGELDGPDCRRSGAQAEDGDAGRPDLLCGGFPCQDLSVAGRRRGLAGERSGLFFEFARIADALRPRWLLNENVPGLLSSNGGRDFGELLGALADLGYGVAWRVLDSRFFGVPQRRRRVFIVGCDLGGRAGAERAGAVLAVGAGCSGHPAAGAAAGPDAAAGPASRARDRGALGVVGTVTSKWANGTGGPSGDECQNLTLAGALDRMAGGADDNAAQAHHLVSHTLTSGGHDASEDGTGRGTPIVPVAFDWQAGDDSPFHEGKGGRKWITRAGDYTGALGHTRRDAVASPALGVRRLTPRECERLQGFPDDWTLIDWKGKPAADSRRYAALGDAVTVPVAEWLGHRLRDEDGEP